jgi:amino acid transporter
METPGDDRSTGGSIGLVQATSVGIGGMVGGGIFAVLGVAATKAGGATPFAFVVGGVIAALTAASYARLSVQHSGGGGTVDILDDVLGVDALTGTLNITLWAGYIATLALYASAFANYASALATGGGPGPVVFRLLVFVGLTVPWLINLTNASLVTKTEGTVVVIKMTILLVVIAAGMPGVSTAAISPADWPGLGQVFAAAMLVFVAYEGFELIANSADDVRSPDRNLPLAFGLSVAIVTVFYVAIAAVVVGSMSAEEIVKSADFALAEAASGPLGSVGFTLVAVSAVLATFSAINATLFGAARLSFSIASEGELPPQLERRTWSQPIGLHITVATSLALAVGLGLSSISAIASSIFLLVFAAVNIAGVVDSGHPVSRVVAGLGALGCVVAFVVLTVETVRDDRVAIIGLVVLITLVLAAEKWWLGRHRVASPT